MFALLNPEFHNLRLSRPTRMQWQNKFGQEAMGHLILPLNYRRGQRYPLVITTYRSTDGFLRGGVGDEYPIQVFAANGFAVLSYDAGIEPSYKAGDLDGAMMRWRGPIASLEAAIAKLDQEGIIDPRLTAITGLSTVQSWSSLAWPTPARLRSRFPVAWVHGIRSSIT